MKAVALMAALFLVASTDARAPVHRCAGPPVLAFSDGGIYTVQADGTHLRLLTKDGSHPAWSPDGTRIAYDVEGSGTTAPGDVYVLTPGAVPERLTADGRGFDPEWSGDGTRIYFVDLNASAAYTIRPDGTGRRAVPSRLYPATWSPDGKSFAVLMPHGLDVVTPSGRRTIARGDVGDAVWAPVGDRIAYFVHGKGLFVVHANGDGRERLGGPAAYSPTWSPDAERIAFASGGDRDPATAIYVGDVRSGRTRAIERSEGADDLHWSPDGSRIAYALGPTVSPRPYDVWTIRPDGSGERNLTGPLPVGRYSAAEDPAWKPCQLASRPGGTGAPR